MARPRGSVFLRKHANVRHVSDLEELFYQCRNGLPGIVSTTGKETGLPFNAILAITHVFSPSLVFDAKLSFMRYTDTTLVGEVIRKISQATRSAA